MKSYQGGLENENGNHPELERGTALQESQSGAKLIGSRKCECNATLTFKIPLVKKQT